jgi:hypothetical protein
VVLLISRDEYAGGHKPTPAIMSNRRAEILADFTTLRLPVTADQLDAALKHAQDAGLSHLEFLHHLLTDQAGLRRERSLTRRLKDACSRDLKPLADFDGDRCCKVKNQTTLGDSLVLRWLCPCFFSYAKRSQKLTHARGCGKNRQRGR